MANQIRESFNVNRWCPCKQGLVRIDGLNKHLWITDYFYAFIIIINFSSNFSIVFIIIIIIIIVIIIINISIIITSTLNRFLCTLLQMNDKF